MKKLLFALVLFALSNNINAQSVKDQSTKDPRAASYKSMKIVFQLTSADTIIHQTLMHQLTNYLGVAPDLKIEVVCHGGGLEMLVKSSSVVQDQIKAFADKGVTFVACEFAMKKKQVTKDQLVAGAGSVMSGVLEIAKKQKEGWSYIKI